MMMDMGERDDFEWMTDDEIARAQVRMEDDLYLSEGDLSDEDHDAAEALDLALVVGAL